MKYRDIIRTLREDGWFEARTTGSHIYFKHLSKPGIVTVPAGGKLSRDIPPGTMRSILKQANLDIMR